MKQAINGIPTELLARCYELIESGGTLTGVAGRFGINAGRLQRAISLARQCGIN